MEKPYEPAPLETSEVRASPTLLALIERLARNAHDVWARKRMAEGLHFGAAKDEVQKTSPLLVPYDELPEDEKETDRAMVRGALLGAIALGWSLAPPPAAGALDGLAAEALEAWERRLQRGMDEVHVREAGAWTFDMDDRPELADPSLARLPRARAALEHLQTVLFPAWERADAEALRLQKRHRTAAHLAIWPGTFAIVCAILQLFLEESIRGSEEVFAKLELAAIAVAAGAVVVGLWLHLHHGWLARRQQAERLRALKFQSLSWPELWCDLEAWKTRVRQEVANLGALGSHAATDWAKEKDNVHPDLPIAPNCDVPNADLRALAAFYRVKRLLFQQHYFEHQTGQATRRSWIVDRRVNVWLFAMSVAIVFLHGIGLIHAKEVERWLIALAAILPVIGFGLRAWVAAFEAPRSRNLYRAKARALDDSVARNRADATDVTRTIHHVAHGEHFFINEHREWYRLQMEAEWF